MSEYEGKKIELSKRVYSFIRDLRVFSIIQERSIQILFFSFLLMKKWNILHLLPKLCKITSNFNLILSDEITAGALHKFFTLTLYGLKVIAAIQGKNVE